MDFLLQGFKALTWHQPVMWLIGGLLIFLAIKKDMEPALLLPIFVVIFAIIIVVKITSYVIAKCEESKKRKEENQSNEQNNT